MQRRDRQSCGAIGTNEAAWMARIMQRELSVSMESQMGQNSPGFHRRVIIKTPF